jgi:hypothetical protein
VFTCAVVVVRARQVVVAGVAVASAVRRGFGAVLHGVFTRRFTALRVVLAIDQGAYLALAVRALEALLAVVTRVTHTPAVQVRFASINRAVVAGCFYATVYAAGHRCADATLAVGSNFALQVVLTRGAITSTIAIRFRAVQVAVRATGVGTNHADACSAGAVFITRASEAIVARLTTGTAVDVTLTAVRMLVVTRGYLARTITAAHLTFAVGVGVAFFAVVAGCAAHAAICVRLIAVDAFVVAASSTADHFTAQRRDAIRVYGTTQTNPTRRTNAPTVQRRFTLVLNVVVAVIARIFIRRCTAFPPVGLRIRGVGPRIGLRSWRTCRRIGRGFQLVSQSILATKGGQ